MKFNNLMTARIRKFRWCTAILGSLFVAFSTIDCGQGDTQVALAGPGPIVFTVLIDDSFSPMQQAAIVSAGTEWVEKLDGSLFLSYAVVQPSDLKETVSEDETISILSRDPGRGAAGWSFWNDSGTGAYILLHPTCCDDLFVRVTAHELGHAFHLRHYDGEGKSIMRPEVDEVLSEITQLDVDAFCKVWKNCPLKTR